MRGIFSAGGGLGTRRHRGRIVLFGLLLTSWHSSLFAGQWQMRPTLQLAETYTDNVALAPPGSEETDFVTQINPGFWVHGEGGRIKLDISSRLQNLIYANDETRNATHLQLAARGTAELVEDIFFLDARSSITQQNIDANGRVGLDDLNVGNQVDVYTYGLSPHLKLRLDSYANADLRYAVDRVESQSGGASDAVSQQYFMNVSSGPSFRRLQWDADFQENQLNRDVGGDSRYKSANADVRYHLFSSWNFLARAGNEDNKTPNIVDPHNGSYWSAGLEWKPSRYIAMSATSGKNNWDANLLLQPSERNSLHIGYRDRDIGLVRGPSWDVLLFHATRRTTWRLSYSEENTTVQTLQISGQQFFTLADNQGNIIVDPTSGLPIVLVRNVFSLTDEDFIRKRGEFAVTMNTGKSDLVFSVFNEQRTYQLSNDSEDVVGTAASWTWQLMPRMHTILGGGWQRRNPINTNDHDDLWHGDIGLVHTLSKGTNVSLDYSHITRNTAISGINEYDENRVSLQLNMSF